MVNPINYSDSFTKSTGKVLVVMSPLVADLLPYLQSYAEIYFNTDYEFVINNYTIYCNSDIKESEMNEIRTYGLGFYHGRNV